MSACEREMLWSRSRAHDHHRMGIAPHHLVGGIAEQEIGEAGAPCRHHDQVGIDALRRCQDLVMDRALDNDMLERNLRADMRRGNFL